MIGASLYCYRSSPTMYIYVQYNKLPQKLMRSFAGVSRTEGVVNMMDDVRQEWFQTTKVRLGDPWDQFSFFWVYEHEFRSAWDKNISYSIPLVMSKAWASPGVMKFVFCYLCCFVGSIFVLRIYTSTTTETGRKQLYDIQGCDSFALRVFYFSGTKAAAWGGGFCVGRGILSGQKSEEERVEHPPPALLCSFSTLISFSLKLFAVAFHDKAIYSPSTKEGKFH